MLLHKSHQIEAEALPILLGARESHEALDYHIIESVDSISRDGTDTPYM